MTSLSAMSVIVGLLDCHAALCQPEIGSSARVFAVASVKPHPKSTPPDRFVHTTAQGLNACTDLFGLMTFAYGVERYQIIGGPPWIHSDYWDIAAKAETDHAMARQDIWPLVQRLMADRFQLTLRRETQDLKGYALIIDRGGLKMKPSAPETDYSFRVGRGQWIVTGIELSMLVGDLSKEAGATVVDMTGLTGKYDLTLDWSADASSTDRPSFFMAVQQQLGLRLESRKMPMAMIVIEHVERPSDN